MRVAFISCLAVALLGLAGSIIFNMQFNQAGADAERAASGIHLTGVSGDSTQEEINAAAHRFFEESQQVEAPYRERQAILANWCGWSQGTLLLAGVAAALLALVSFALAIRRNRWERRVGLTVLAGVVGLGLAWLVYQRVQCDGYNYKAYVVGNADAPNQGIISVTTYTWMVNNEGWEPVKVWTANDRQATFRRPKCR